MSVKIISIATDFSETPAGRYINDGPFTGQRFREEFLVPALKKFDNVVIDLDGTLGFGSSFLEEAFGGLIREHGFRLEEINKKMEIISSRKLYKERIYKYLENAEIELNK